MEFNLADLFEHAVDAFGDREYLVAEGRRHTYAEMEARAVQDHRVRRLVELRALLKGTPVRLYRVERAERARLVVELWCDDPTAWSGRHLAAAAGTSRAWVTGVIKAALSAPGNERAAG